MGFTRDQAGNFATFALPAYTDGMVGFNNAGETILTIGSIFLVPTIFGMQPAGYTHCLLFPLGIPVTIRTSTTTARPAEV